MTRDIRLAKISLGAMLAFIIIAGIAWSRGDAGDVFIAMLFAMAWEFMLTMFVVRIRTRGKEVDQ
jgi:hypothetical protein